MSTNNIYNKLNFEDYLRIIRPINASYGIDGTLTGVSSEKMFSLVSNEEIIDKALTKFPALYKLSCEKQKEVLYVWIAANIYSVEVDTASHTTGLSPAIETSSFNTDLGILTDNKNMYLKIFKATLGIGASSSVRVKTLSYAKNTKKVSGEKGSLGYNTLIHGRYF